MLLLLLACAEPTDSAVAETPTVEFVNPTEGEVIQAGDSNVSIAVNHFVLVDPAKHSDNGAEGVIHFTMVQGSDSEDFETSSTTFTVTLAAGEAMLTADLIYADGDAITDTFPDYEAATVTITVE